MPGALVDVPDQWAASLLADLPGLFVLDPPVADAPTGPFPTARTRPAEGRKRGNAPGV